MANYSISREAKCDLDEILIYIAADDIASAISLNERLNEMFEMLATNPMAGRERPELGEHLRSFPEKNYVVFYRQWAGKVVIVRVIHAARDLDEIFS